jgi:hypothetical protein
MHTAPHTGESGQAVIESAIVMPLLIFFCLGIVQLTVLQQAKLMTEYAAFQAARAGIVSSGNNERMHDAAVVALLPTMGRTSDRFWLGRSFREFQRADEVLSQLAWGVGPKQRAVNGSNLLGLIRVDTVNPGPLAGDWQELDFDGSQREATLLQIRLRYWYELRIPFANWVVFLAWYASNAEIALHGSIDRPTTRKQNLLGPSGDHSAMEGQGKGIPQQHGFDTLQTSELRVLWALANGSAPHYLLPLSATYSLRMQSNFHRKWLMHGNP